MSEDPRNLPEEPQDQDNPEEPQVHPLDQPPGAQSQPPAQPRIEPQRVAIRLPQVTPYVTYGLLGFTIIIFLLQMITEFAFDPRLCPWFEPGSVFSTGDLPACYGLKDNGLILNGQLWRLITPVFLHAGLLHIGFNMYALYILGPELERHYGSWKFLAMYLVSGFAGVVASFVLTEAPSLGASTAVFGLFAAQGVFFYQNQRVFGPRARAAFFSIVRLAVINFLIGLTPGIDNWGHFGGALGGVMIAWVGGPIYQLVGEAPDLSLKNQRDDGDFILAMIATFILAALLAGGWIFISNP
ncbi:MAG: rhomboid family intramembrane serine protease [Chloroflexi bacterium]|nr:MAG: rhomboid family intramembrane serine protease [Chloroflexota bacterium]MBL1193001.1 rhomboid family intramembrane serine protease [Chloroflexota bacterium]NOH10294.1 rhomboid family intramembrane serine protease [Chloroflexota bacterium]